jgi:hypothetical protein
VRDVVVLELDRGVTAREVASEAARLALGTPAWEDALAFVRR